MAPNPSNKPQEMINRWKMDQSNNTIEIKNQTNINKWVRGTRDVGDLIKKYNISNEGRKLSKTNTWRRKNVAEQNIPQMIDDRYIKKYTDYSEMLSLFEVWTRKYPKISESFSLGTSEEGRKLECFHIASHVRQPRPLLRPMVKYVANIHGDEVVGRELLIGLARYLTENYDQDPRIRRIVDTTDIFLVPSVNPDGFEIESRYNVNEEDLNRAFPGWRDRGLSSDKLFEDREKEVRVMMKWILHNPFVLSVSFHDGRVMINYPWDDSPGAVEGEKAECPDDDVFGAISSIYANNHPFMWTGKCLCHSDTFSAGISNGAEWYLVDNGMQDFNYLFSNCLEVTAELSCWKKPEECQLDVEWDNNLESLLSVLESVHSGVRGLVMDRDTGEPVRGAEVMVGDREKAVTTSSRGEFWRLLVPGSYDIRAFHRNKYGSIESDTQRIVITNNIGDGAIETTIFCKFVIHLNFLVVGVKNGGCKYYDSCFFKEITELFNNSEHCEIELNEAGYKTIERKGSTARQVAFSVKVRLSEGSVAEYFEDRWQERVARPGSEAELERLDRRLRMYAQEAWCGKRDEWTVSLVTQPDHKNREN